IPYHVSYPQIFKEDHRVTKHKRMAQLVSIVAALITDSLMYSCHSLFGLLSLFASFRRFRELPLCLCKLFLFLCEKPRGFYLLSIAQSKKGAKSSIGSHCFSTFRKGKGFNLAGKADIPFPGTGAANRAGLYTAGYRTMKLDLYMPNLRENKLAVLYLEPGLGKGKRVISRTRAEARIARIVSLLYSSKEGIHRAIQSLQYILEHLRMDCLKILTKRFDLR